MKKNLRLVNADHPVEESEVFELIRVGPDKYMECCAGRAMKKMLTAALKKGVRLSVVSAYRSFKYQAELFERSIRTRMADGMNAEEAVCDTAKCLAVAGASEHNAGLAADLMGEKDTDVDERFAQTKEFDWLKKNAHKFGFVLRYPEGAEAVTGYVYEPWHFRYVGRHDACRMKKSGKCLEEYLRSV
ncbi:MAG: M15 family metallopeptidase [Oscillospiraceae bacterium]